MPTKFWILVYIGSPLDFTEYRHTALYFEFPSGASSIMHVIGTQGLFIFEEQTDHNPRTSESLAKIIPVGEIADSISPAAIRKAVASTPIKNGRLDRDWNCQNWIGDACAELVENGYMNKAQRVEAIDKMMDACLEAADE